MARHVNINTQIRASQIRVIGPDGAQIGILPLEEALRLADGQELDLVEVSPTATPPVCRIMDYGKYKYQQSKRAQESRKKQATVDIKEVKFRPRTERHDYGFKVGHVRAFLGEGHKVKITVTFRGRELAHVNLGRAMIDRVVEDTKDVATIEVPARLEGRNMIMIVTPKAGAVPPGR